MNSEQLIQKTNESYLKIIPLMNIINKKFINYNKQSDINKYYRFIKKPDILTKYGIITSIFIDNKYMPAILNTGFNLKNKTKYNTICMVQDKPYFEDGLLKFTGLSDNEINDIKKLFDVVIGIDLLHSNGITDYPIEYKNVFYYCTKALCLGLTIYDKLIYLDASTHVNLSIDNIFDEYNESSYYLAPYHEKTIRGTVGNFFIIIPQINYISKLLYLIKNYGKFFISKNYFSYFTPDEDIIFFTVYPNWNATPLPNLLYFNVLPNIQNNNNDNYPLYGYVRIKPFRYPLINDFYERFLFNNFLSYYSKWDDIVRLLIIQYPELLKYFEYIKTFRYTNF